MADDFRPRGGCSREWAAAPRAQHPTGAGPRERPFFSTPQTAAEAIESIEVALRADIACGELDAEGAEWMRRFLGRLSLLQSQAMDEDLASTAPRRLH